jgi:flagellar hook-associated protein 1 FlgK
MLGISIAGAGNYDIEMQGGQLGGLLTLKNSIVADINDNLDSLATAIIQQVNQYHVQGVGSEGSFMQLTGWQMISEDLVDFDPPVSDGKIYIRVTDTSTGQITRNEIDIDVSTDSLTTIAADISAITGLSASVADNRLYIQAGVDYTFDFLPCVLPVPTASNLTGAPPPAVSVSGIYNGTTNQTFTFTVIGTDSVGKGSLQLEVTDGAGSVIANLNVGAGYAAGDKLDIGNGIKISLSIGDLNAGDTFEVDAFSSSDTSGVLAAVGINTFFSGSSAVDIAVCSDISATPGRISTALGPDMTDNTNALRLSGLRDVSLSSLNEMTPSQFYHRLVSEVGQQIFNRQIQQENVEAIIQNLISQQGDISGVNINEEAAQMLVYEQMFQAMAKYLNTIQTAILTFMEIV